MRSSRGGAMYNNRWSFRATTAVFDNANARVTVVNIRVGKRLGSAVALR